MKRSENAFYFINILQLKLNNKLEKRVFSVGIKLFDGSVSKDLETPLELLQ